MRACLGRGSSLEMRCSSALFGILVLALQPGLVLASQASVGCGPIAHVLTERVEVSGTSPLPAACDREDRAQVWSVGGGVGVIRCALPQPADAEDGASTGALFIQRGDSVLYSLQGNAIPTMDGADGLVALRADLSGDGVPETILAAHESQSQGMGVNRWTLLVFDSAWTFLGSRSEVADWGPQALVPREPVLRDGQRTRPPGCAVLITDWQDVEAPGGRRELWLRASRADVRGDIPRLEIAPGEFAARRLDRRFEAIRRRSITRSDGLLREPEVWLAREIAHALQEEHVQ